jgi:hypothetical protein
MAIRFSPAALVLAALLALAGCGGSSGSKGNGVTSESPAAALAAAKGAAEGAGSVRIAGHATEKGTPVGLNVQLVAGRGAQGEISQGSLSFYMIELGGTMYIKGSPAFYRHFGGAAAAQLFEGKWLKAPANSPEFAPLRSLTDMHTLLGSLLSSSQATTLKRAGTATVEGSNALVLTDPTSHSALYIATTGKPYPLVVTKAGAEGGRLALTQWDAPVSLRAPAGAIDLSALQSHS